jgi:hypothetical protein
MGSAFCLHHGRKSRKTFGYFLTKAISVWPTLSKCQRQCRQKRFKRFDENSSSSLSNSFSLTFSKTTKPNVFQNNNVGGRERESHKESNNAGKVI